MLSYMKNYFIVLHAIILIANNKERGIFVDIYTCDNQLHRKNTR